MQAMENRLISRPQDGAYFVSYRRWFGWSTSKSISSHYVRLHPCLLLSHQVNLPSRFPRAERPSAYFTCDPDERRASSHHGLRTTLLLSNAIEFSGNRSKRSLRLPAVRCLSVSLPLVPPSNHWGTWSVLLCIAAFGIWSEKATEWGGMLSGALVSTLIGLAASNVGLIATDAPAYSIVNQYLLPLSVPLLLLKADLRVVVLSTGRLLLAFCLGSVATIIGTIVGMKVVPLQMLGSDGWKIAAALMSRHIGGAVNYVAVCEAFNVSSSALAAGLAADNLICAVYFTTVFALASRLPKDYDSDVDKEGESERQDGPRAYIPQTATALALSCVICFVGHWLTRALNVPGGIIPCATMLVVLIATLFPSLVGPLAPAGEALAIIVVQVFFTVVGANASIWTVLRTAPYLFIFSFIQIAVHLALILSIGRFLGFEQKLLLLASNANVGGPTTAAGLATTKGWKSLIVPGILAGIFGVAIATFISLYLGVTVLKFL
ncbi:hypothetical protein KP509_28G001600 [Ceratopteris richardii]|uniref:Membrane protein YjcL n=1 Tax=Ceratopteris richardii TaxID=49495 RepID=A0A8T2R913_CERRI|nr:hypothetical protein KP509_28G001600 [Ceratopteris richardii]